MPRFNQRESRLSASEQLHVINPERIAVKVARDSAKAVARIACGEDHLPAGHAELRDGLRVVIAEQLHKAKAQL